MLGQKDLTISEITNKLIASSRDINAESELKKTNEGNDLDEAGLGNGIGSENSSDPVGVGIERMSSVVNVALRGRKSKRTW